MVDDQESSTNKELSALKDLMASLEDKVDELETVIEDWDDESEEGEDCGLEDPPRTFAGPIRSKNPKERADRASKEKRDRISQAKARKSGSEWTSVRNVDNHGDLAGSFRPEAEEFVPKSQRGTTEAGGLPAGRPGPFPQNDRFFTRVPEWYQRCLTPPWNYGPRSEEENSDYLNRVLKLTIPKFSSERDECLPWRCPFTTQAHNKDVAISTGVVCLQSYIDCSHPGLKDLVPSQGWDTSRYAVAFYDWLFSKLPKEMQGGHPHWRKANKKVSSDYKALLQFCRAELRYRVELEAGQEEGKEKSKTFYNPVAKQVHPSVESALEALSRELLWKVRNVTDFSKASPGSCKDDDEVRSNASGESQAAAYWNYRELPMCPHCEKKHWLTRCEWFQEGSVKARKTFIQKQRLCHNCFSNKHAVKECPSKNTCGVNDCGQRHHQMLHKASQARVNMARKDEDTRVPSSDEEDDGPQSRAFQMPTRHGISLRVLPVKLYDPGGEAKLVYNQLKDIRDESTPPFKGKEIAMYVLKAAMPRSVRREAWDIKLSEPVKKQWAIERHKADDNLDSFDTAEEAMEVIKQLKDIYGGLRVNLREFASNDKSVVMSVPEDERAKAYTTNLMGELSSMPTLEALGVTWGAEEDIMSFEVLQMENETCTKKAILKAYARLLDPLGFVLPFIIQARILFQECWLANLDWDDETSPEVVEAWQQRLRALRDVPEVAVPRCLIPNALEVRNRQLHVFANASGKACAAVSYLRSEYTAAGGGREEEIKISI